MMGRGWKRGQWLAAMWALGATCSLSVASGRVEVQGRVVHVDDGDTVVLLLADKSKMKVRLASIDAPESSRTNKERGKVGQPFSENSKQYLASMVKGVDVTARCFEEDRYKRSVCDIMVRGVSANRQMVIGGMAWANQSSGGRYLRDKSLVKAEEQARASQLGLWKGSSPVPPWEWRKACWTEGRCNGGL